MKPCKNIVLTVVAICILTGCKSNSNSQLIAKVIDTHESTVIYVCTSWCQASKETFFQDVLPYLEEPNEKIGFVLIHFGEKNEIPEMILKRNMVINLSSFEGLDKLVANIRFYALLKDYHYHNAMPMTILVNSQRHVTNYDPEKNRFLSFTEVLCQIKQP